MKWLSLCHVRSVKERINGRQYSPDLVRRSVRVIADVPNTSLHLIRIGGKFGYGREVNRILIVDGQGISGVVINNRADIRSHVKRISKVTYHPRAHNRLSVDARNTVSHHLIDGSIILLRRELLGSWGKIAHVLNGGDEGLLDGIRQAGKLSEISLGSWRTYRNSITVGREVI